MASDGQIASWKREFEEKGATKVAEELLRELYGPRSGQKARMALAFLENLRAEEQRAFRESESTHGVKTVGLAEDANEIARPANDLASESNRIAKRAQTFAGWALFISLLAIIVAIATWSRSP